jgi:hypothetical protein
VYAPITQPMVNEYHSIIDSLEDATGESLQNFSIPSAAMAQRQLSEIRRRLSAKSAYEPQLSVDSYCDKVLFNTKIEGLWDHIVKIGYASTIQRTSS